jgi:hypothetical protein
MIELIARELLLLVSPTSTVEELGKGERDESSVTFVEVLSNVD